MILRRHVDLSGDARGIMHSKGAVQEFESRFSDYLGRRCIATGSGREGLRMLLARYEPGEVIMPAYTLADLVDVIRGAGHTPVFADIDPESFNIDRKHALARVGPKTRAIIATHIFGNPCDCDFPHVAVVEDCAHALGSKRKGKMAGTLGDGALFSFENIKLLNTYGGGMVTSESRCPRHHPFMSARVMVKMITARFENAIMHSPAGRIPLTLLDRKSSAFERIYRLVQPKPGAKPVFTRAQAGIGMQKLASLEDRIKARSMIASLYMKHLPKSFKPQKVSKGDRHAYYFYVGTVRDDTRKVRSRMLDHGIDCGILSEITDCCDGSCPQAAWVHRHALQLPMHERLREKDVIRICKVMARIIGNT